MKIGFIGAGNMAQALIAGLVHSGKVKGSNIMVHDPVTAHLEKLTKAFETVGALSNETIIQHSEVVFLAVKPHMMEAVLRPLAPIFKEHKPLVISIAAGTSLASIAAMVNQETLHLVRILPNLGVGINAGMVALCTPSDLPEYLREKAQDLLQVLGRVMPMEEHMLTPFSSIGGASYAFAYMFMDALAKGALQEGIPKVQGIEIAAQAMLGAAKLCLESKEHPALLIDKVCSPQGTTICGVKALEEGAFVGTIMRAVAATSARDKEILTQKKS